MAESGNGKEKFCFFYRNQSPFSQWYSATFTVNGVTYCCAEQYMMHQKALLFGDLAVADQVMKTKDPKKQKSLGRKVQNFDQSLWDSKCRDIVKDGNKAKFSQNPDLLDCLLETKGATLVEASPVDKIWGIGLAESDPRAHDRATWQGKNWLGFALTEVREQIIQEQAAQG